MTVQREYVHHVKVSEAISWTTEDQLSTGPLSMQAKLNGPGDITAISGESGRAQAQTSTEQSQHSSCESMAQSCIRQLRLTGVSGAWKGGKRHGPGVCHFADGTVFRGQWEEDAWLQSPAEPSLCTVAGPGLSHAVAGQQAAFSIQVGCYLPTIIPASSPSTKGLQPDQRLSSHSIMLKR